MDGPTPQNTQDPPSNVHKNADGSYDVAKSIPGLNLNYHITPAADGTATFSATGVNTLTGSTGSGAGTIANGSVQIDKYTETTAQGAQIIHNLSNEAQAAQVLRSASQSAMADVQKTINPSAPQSGPQGPEQQAAQAPRTPDASASLSPQQRTAQLSQQLSSTIAANHHIDPAIQQQIQDRIAQSTSRATLPASHAEMAANASQALAGSRMAEVPGVQAVLNRASGQQSASSGSGGAGPFEHHDLPVHTNKNGMTIQDSITTGPNGFTKIHEVATSADGKMTITSDSFARAGGKMEVGTVEVNEKGVGNTIYTKNTHVPSGMALRDSIQDHTQNVMKDLASGGSGNVAPVAPPSAEKIMASAHENTTHAGAQPNIEPAFLTKLQTENHAVAPGENPFKGQHGQVSANLGWHPNRGGDAASSTPAPAASTVANVPQQQAVTATVWAQAVGSGSSQAGNLNRPYNNYMVTDSSGRVTQVRPDSQLKFARFGEDTATQFVKASEVTTSKTSLAPGGDPTERLTVGASNLKSVQTDTVARMSSMLQQEKAERASAGAKRSLDGLYAQKAHLERTGQAHTGAHDAVNQQLGHGKGHLGKH